MKRPKSNGHHHVVGRTYHRGMWIPKKEIEHWEGHFEGKLVRNEALCTMLEGVAQRYVERTGEHPGMLRVKEMPFNYYHPVLVVAELFEMGISGVPTNKYIFIERKKQW